MSYQTISSPPAAQAEVQVNENMAALGQGFVFSHNKPADSGLVVGINGGDFDANTVADATVTGTDNATNYIVAHRTTRALTIATSTTNWNNTATYGRVARAVFAAGVLTYHDERQSAGGIFDHGAALSVGTGDVVGPGSATDGHVALFDGATGKLIKDGGAPAAAPVLIQIACSDEATALTAGTAKVTFRAPYAFTLTAVRASVNTAPTGGTLLTVDVNESGTSVLSTKLTFDASEKTTTTAATAAVISDSSIADDAEISIDIDSIGSTIAGAGLKVTLIGTKP